MCDQHQRRQHGPTGMEKHPPGCGTRCGMHRQHGKATARIIVAIGNGQAPEVGGRPQEHKQGQHYGPRLIPVANGGAAAQHRRAAGCAADDDVERRARLEPDGIHPNVDRCPHEQKEGQRRVEGQHCQRGQQDHQRPGIGYPPCSRQGPGRERAPPGAFHPCIQLLLQVLVDGRCPARCQSASNQEHGQRAHAWPATRGDKGTAHRRKE